MYSGIRFKTFCGVEFERKQKKCMFFNAMTISQMLQKWSVGWLHQNCQNNQTVKHRLLWQNAWFKRNPLTSPNSAGFYTSSWRLIRRRSHYFQIECSFCFIIPFRSAHCCFKIKSSCSELLIFRQEFKVIVIHQDRAFFFHFTWHFPNDHS